MLKNENQIIQQATTWLNKDVFPLWTKKGIDPLNGSFVESLTLEGEPTTAPRRAMVQARQIYSYSEAVKMNVLAPKEVNSIIEKSTRFLIEKYSLPSGAFIYSINAEEKPEGCQLELYTQAFALFCLARSYEILGQAEIKTAAKKLLHYLLSERRAPCGGFIEIKNEQSVYHSNPHMHLFEATIEWMKVAPDQEWKEITVALFELCTNKFIDQKTGAVAEFFDEKWQPLKEDGKFIFEPGHQYEWAWLMLEFKKVVGVEVGQRPKQLYDLGEKFGLRESSQFVIDEVWSDLTAKKLSSRFWPQCERIKTAVSLGLQSPSDQQANFAKSADAAMMTLFKYLEVSKKGLWRDTFSEAGNFDQLPAKASSLYHIINAFSEYKTKRPLLRSPD